MPNSISRSRLISRATLAAMTFFIAIAAQAGNEPQLERSVAGNAGAEQGLGKRAGAQTYIIRLSEPAVANYMGGVRSLRATSTRATGSKKLDARSAESQAYVAHLKSKQDAVLSALRGTSRSQAVPARRYFYAVNGLAMRMTAAEAEAAAKISGVVSVQRDVAYPLDTDRGPTLIGAPGVWDGSATGVAAQGEGMVVGIMDTGINQGHPSFAEVGDDGYGASGEYAATNPFGAGGFAGGARDDCTSGVVVCNNKLIGSHAFIDANGGVDPFSPPGDPVSKDTDGHGSHVASTAAGNVIINPPLLDADGNDSGQSLGTVSGVAPHAHIIAYKVCAPSCFGTDIAAAIDQAILDGADALNHSIGAASGSPWNDLKSLAFKGARAAGIMLQNSAGNSGPAAGTAGRINASPWATGVGASTHDRAFPPKFLQDMIGGDTAAPADMSGNGVTGPFTGPIVFAGDFVNGDPDPEQCLNPFPAGTFSSTQIVVCDRGTIARVDKARNVRDGGAGGMILANVAGGATSTNDDVHVIPAIHVNAADGDVLRAWLASGTGHEGMITGTGPAFSDPGAADIMADFSSRGPYTGFDFLAPHVAAPGVAIYAAGADLAFEHPGEGNDAPSVATEWGIIGGTSMASPHATGSATLVKQLNPTWTAAEVKSALMTTAIGEVMRKEDGITPADPFDFGGGRVRVNLAAAAGLVMDETIANFDAADPALGGDPSTLNLPDLVAETCAPVCSWQRIVTNVSGSTMTWGVTGETSVPGFVVNASPSSFTLADGASQTIDVSADATFGNAGWNFGKVVMTAPGLPQQHLTVAAQFQTSTSPLFTKSVDTDTASVGDTLSYQIDLTNIGESGVITITDPLPAGTSFVAGSAGSVINGGTDISAFAYDAGSDSMVWQGTLDTGGVVVVSDPFPPAGSPFGYLDLPGGFGVAPVTCSTTCDDTFVEFSGLPPFAYAGTVYTDLIVGSNGTLIPGTDSTDAASNANQNMPDATTPNNVIAPFWTDLDLDGTDAGDTGAGNIYAAVFNGGEVIVIEWQGVEVWNNPGPTFTFQVQIATEATANPGIWFVYADLAALPASLTVGAENVGALAGDSHYFNGAGTAPFAGDLGDLRIDSSTGGSAVFTFDALVGGGTGDTVINIANYSAGTDETALAITQILAGPVDSDNDGVPDADDLCPGTPPGEPVDADGCSASQLDEDDDGVSDADDLCPGTPPGEIVDSNGCSFGQLDEDGDGVTNDTDNCTLVANPDQRDSNGDGFGNICDADLNNDCIVNAIDLGLLKSVFFTADPDADFNGDGIVNVQDLGLMKQMFFQPPGPSALGSCEEP